MDSNTAPRADPALLSDTESASHVETGASIDFELTLDDNHGTNLDSSANRTSSENEIAPKQVHGSDRICHPCWQRADKVPVPASASAGPSTINLPNFTRAPDTQANCFCPNCESAQHLVVPKWLRVKLFTDFNFYVPKKCRICSFHLLQNNWDEVLKTFLHPCHSFTAEHVQDFASFV